MEWCAAARMWRAACTALHIPEAERAWERVVQASPPDCIWHSLRNCVAYQAGVWQNLLARGITEPVQPAAFKLAIVLRHTPTEIAVKLLGDMLSAHPAAMQQDLSSYILALMTDDEATWCGNCPPPSANSDDNSDSEDATPPGPAPLRDLQLFGDCELAILAAGREEYDAHSKLVRAEYSKMAQDHYIELRVKMLDRELAILAAGREEYDAHSKLVRAEYSKMAQDHYIELRVKVLNQFSQIPKLFHTEEFAFLEAAARENIDREINTLREHLLTGQAEHS